MTKPITTVFLMIFLMTPALPAQETAKPVDTNSINFRYKENYSFVTMPDTIYTFEGEFILPEGFHHTDSSKLNAFQNYVANFPLWHRHLPVGSFRRQQIYDYLQISRPVHLPYNGPAYTDYATPVRILAEYLHDQGREFDMAVVPHAGDTMTYAKWLGNDITYGRNMAVQFSPSEPKDTTLIEYYTFMRFGLENTTYQSLAYNCDSVKSDKLKPGDLFVAHDDEGKKGVVYVIMHMLENKKGKKLYAVATGCEIACDFHIPLYNNDKNNPWLTAAQIFELNGEFPRRGFLRFKIH